MRHLAITALAGVLLLLAPALSTAAEAGDPLIGLWRYQTRAAPGSHGQLVLTHRGAAWRAAIGGLTARGGVHDGQVRLAVAGGQGELRASVGAAGGEFDGFWIQPPQALAGPTLAYATPVALKPAGAGVWRGLVRPLPRSATLWLNVSRDADGDLVAAFRPTPARRP